MSLPRTSPSAVEIPLADGLIVRGQAWAGPADAAILLHEPARDLDAWGDLPELLHGDGLAVLAIDLPGHGLSDDPWQPERLPEMLAAVLAAIPEQAGNHFVLASGVCATAALLAAAEPSIAGIVALSPTGQDELPEAAPPPPRPMIVFAGAADPAALAAARLAARRAPGWTLVSSIATVSQGTDLLDGAWGAQVREQIRGFIRHCRFGQPRRTPTRPGPAAGAMTPDDVVP